MLSSDLFPGTTGNAGPAGTPQRGMAGVRVLLQSVTLHETQRRWVVSELLTYDLKGSIATITMDAGKANCLSLPMLRELNEALSQAAADGGVGLLTGRDGCVSAGFDLAVLGPDRP